MSFRDLFIFAAGAAIGSAVTWKLIKTKYEKIANDEIREMRDFYYNLASENDDIDEYECEEAEDYTPDESEKEEYENVVESTGYRNYSNKKEKEVEDLGRPYVISPEVFDTEDYEVVSLLYFDDGVLTDEQYNVIDDVEGLVGEDSLNHFGEYEDDSVFVRDDEKKIDYEILADGRKFSEIE